MNKMFFGICLTTLMAAAAMGQPTLDGLTVEGRRSPLGLDVDHPRFGWKIKSEKRNVRQKSYHLLVASSLEKLNQGMADVWDSREVKSDSSQWVGYKGPGLKPNTDYYWKVKIVTNKGKTDWSQPTKWSTGLMAPDRWKGCWIGLDSLSAGDNMGKHSRLATRYLRKNFSTKGGVKRAVMHISGLGSYTLFINGERIGNDIMTPVPTDYTKTVAYNTYDVTSCLKQKNTIGVMLAAGHYFAQRQNYQTNVRTTYGFPKMKANLIIEYSDGRQETVSTDDTWLLNVDGAIRYANEYDGELFDARLAWKGWSQPSFDDSRWKHAREVSDPGGTLRGNITPEMSIYRTDEPVKLRKFGKRYILDFGTNEAGRIRLKAKGRPGDTVCVRHAELLQKGDSLLYTDNLRSAEATARYVSDGTTRDFVPEFTYYGFRYAEITGLDSLRPEDVCRELIADQMDEEGNSFYAEDTNGESLVNKIVANARRGIRSNYKGMPIDCPQRDERMPWLGDRTTGCLGESFLMDNHSLYAKWTSDICESQRPDGNISDVAPAYWRLYTGNVTWPAALPFACDMLYTQYGDLNPMRRCYPHIKKFLDFIRKNKRKDGLITADRYGDWCVPPESPKMIHSKDPARITDGTLLASAYYAYLCRMMSRYARLIGLQQDGQAYEEEARTIAETFQERFFKGGIYSNGTVTANLLPLAMGLVPRNSEKEVTDSLVNTIKVKNDSHLSAGVIGIQWLMRYLSDSGNGPLAYQLATAETYPGWGYMLKKGATTIWELWNGDTANPKMNSANHVMLLGDLLPWCFERLGGIRADSPGFKTIILKPDFNVKTLKKVKTSHATPYGVVRSEWTRDKGCVTWTVTTPPNTSATVCPGQGKTKEIGSGTYTFRWKEK